MKKKNLINSLSEREKKEFMRDCFQILSAVSQKHVHYDYGFKLFLEILVGVDWIIIPDYRSSSFGEAPVLTVSADKIGEVKLFLN